MMRSSLTSIAALAAKVRRRLKYPPEAVVQRQVVALLTAAGCTVMTTSQGYRAEKGGTRMSPGIPDLLVWLPDGRQGWVEVKSHAGLLLHRRMLRTPASQVSASAHRDWVRAHHQAVFGGRCVRGLVPYVLGGVPEVSQWIQEGFK